ncbi:glutathione S-transferase T3-like [Helianthus annuus]|uniref:glutathione S-transferase T3-like n=1 Tax=Helianthus annuus TaxID=4232 RepID=UPI0016531FFC|nr:glutathione S-transferase T3-like [Helianthus annuus]
MAFVKSSTCPIIGNNQTGSSFWKATTERFNGLMEQGPLRDLDSVSGKWRKMSKAINTFSGCYNQIYTNPPSGSNDEDILNLAFVIKDVKQRWWKAEYARWEIGKLDEPFKEAQRAKRWNEELECYMDPRGNPVVDPSKVDFKAVTNLLPRQATFNTRRLSDKEYLPDLEKKIRETAAEEEQKTEEKQIAEEGQKVEEEQKIEEALKEGKEEKTVEDQKAETEELVLEEPEVRKSSDLLNVGLIDEKENKCVARSRIGTSHRKGQSKKRGSWKAKGGGSSGGGGSGAGSKMDELISEFRSFKELAAEKYSYKKTLSADYARAEDFRIIRLDLNSVPEDEREVYRRMKEEVKKKWTS